MLASNDITIRKERSLNEVIFSIEDKIISLQNEISALRQETKNEISALRQETKNEISALRQEMRDENTNTHAQIAVLSEKYSSLNDKLGTMQFTLSWSVSAISLLLIALPLIWSIRKFMKLSFREIIREIIREELTPNPE